MPFFVIFRFTREKLLVTVSFDHPVEELKLISVVFYGHQVAPLDYFGHQVAPFELVPNLATRWRHFHWLQIWPPDGATCIQCVLSWRASGDRQISLSGSAMQAFTNFCVKNVVFLQVHIFVQKHCFLHIFYTILCFHRWFSNRVNRRR